MRLHFGLVIILSFASFTAWSQQPNSDSVVNEVIHRLKPRFSSGDEFQRRGRFAEANDCLLKVIHKPSGLFDFMIEVPFAGHQKKIEVSNIKNGADGSLKKVKINTYTPWEVEFSVPSDSGITNAADGVDVRFDSKGKPITVLIYKWPVNEFGVHRNLFCNFGSN